MPALNRLAIAIALSLAWVTCNAAETPQTTNYCLVDPVQADTGHGTFPLGNFEMKARLAVSGSHYVLDAWNVMPDNSQTLEIHADGTYQRSGPTRIRFIDNYNNRGRGNFTATKAKLKIDLERVKATPEGLNIGRNYGSYELSSHGCTWLEQ